MKAQYRLVKLKTETVEDLHRLKDETGQASLNDLIIKMIQFTEAYRHDGGLIIPPGSRQLPLK